MGLEKALLRLDGVETFAMKLSTGTVTLGVRRGTMLHATQLEEAVDSAGLTLQSHQHPEPPKASDG